MPCLRVICDDGYAGFAFLENRYDLRFGEPRLLHRTFLRLIILPEKSSYRCLPIGEAYGISREKLIILAAFPKPEILTCDARCT
jgi:hypothetical protein